MDYLLVRGLHETCVLASGTGFAARFALGLAGRPRPRSRLTRALPHALDTLLLASALTLLALAHLNPLATPWLRAKLVGLLLYIAFGYVALRPDVPRLVRAVAGFAALETFAWIVSVAFTKQPLGFLAVLVAGG
ncbi:MAG TPA: SirB2 family protein [Burkholderiaceae bacterium]